VILISAKIELLRQWCVSFRAIRKKTSWHRRWNTIRGFSCFAAFTCPGLALQFTSIEGGTCLLVEFATFSANADRYVIEYIERVISVRTKLRQPMPMGTKKEQSQDCTIVRFGEEPIKDWYRALKYIESPLDQPEIEVCKKTNLQKVLEIPSR
jgi:hypothetical protein